MSLMGIEYIFESIEKAPYQISPEEPGIEGAGLEIWQCSWSAHAREGTFHAMVYYLVLIALNTVGLCDQSPEKVRGPYKRGGEATDAE